MRELANTDLAIFVILAMVVLIVVAGLVYGFGSFVHNRLKAKDKQKQLDQAHALNLAKESTRQQELQQQQLALRIRLAERQAGLADDKITRFPELGEPPESDQKE